MASSPASSTGTYAATSRTVAVSAFDYRTGRWAPLPAVTASGQLLAGVPSSSRFLGPGGALQVRLSSPLAPLNVYGEVPTLSAVAAGHHPITSTSKRAA